MRELTSRVPGIATFALFAISASPALADNNVTLQRFGDCIVGPITDSGEQSNCIGTQVHEEHFRLFSRDLALVMAPRGLVTGETLGEAGFAFQIDHSFNTIPAEEEYWSLADLDRSPSDSMATTQFHFRKGLPLGLEVGGLVTVLWDSDLNAVGGELRYAFHEDFLWPVPDLSARGFVNALVGHPQLNLLTTGFDVVLGVPIGIAGAVNVSPYAGYNMTIVIASSRLIDASPTDPTPPVTNVTEPALSNAPEFVFDTPEDLHAGEEMVSHMLAGLRVQAAIVDVTFQSLLLGPVKSFSIGLGLDF